MMVYIYHSLKDENGLVDYAVIFVFAKMLKFALNNFPFHSSYRAKIHNCLILILVMV